MNGRQRLALRALVRRLLPELGRDALMDLLLRRSLGEDHPLLNEPTLEPVWAQPEVLGWAYQYAQETQKQRLFRRLLQEGAKVGDAELAVATQLFTPSWIVRFLLVNSLGRLWLQMHPDSRLRSAMPERVPMAEAEEGGGQLLRLAREIRILDPACGAMHMGLAAYDLLCQIYREEWERAGQPGWPEQPSVEAPAAIPGAILRWNLHGIDIDPAVLAVAQTALARRAGGEPANLILSTAPLGALDRAGWQAGGPFHIIMANPPYLARRHATPHLAAHLAQQYPEGKGDLYTAFLQRSVELLAPGGRLAMIAQSSFLFLRTYEPLRRWLLERVAVEALAHLGPGAFAEIAGEKVNTAAFILRREEQMARREAAEGWYVRLLEGGEEQKHEALQAALRGEGRVYRVKQPALRQLPGSPWLYWLPSELSARYQGGERLGDRVRFCRGITTAENQRFTRYWWEVGHAAVQWGCRSAAEAASASKRWFPYMKGAGPVRWFGNLRHVIDWADGGRALRASPRAAVRNLDFQFRAGVTYGSVTGGSMTARWMDEGALFDQACNALFPHDPADGPLLLALLNHPVAGFTAGLNPTVNIVASDLNRVPWPHVDRRAVAGVVEVCIALGRELNQWDDRSPFFNQPPHPAQDEVRVRLQAMAAHEKTLGEMIDEGLGLSLEARRTIREEQRPLPTLLRTSAEMAEAWVCYGLGILLGRCRPGGYGGGPLLQQHWGEVALLVRPEGMASQQEATLGVGRILAILLGEESAARVGRGLQSDLGTSFQRQHARTYGNRPVFWLLEDRPGQGLWLFHERLPQATDALPSTSRWRHRLAHLYRDEGAR